MKRFLAKKNGLLEGTHPRRRIFNAPKRRSLYHNSITLANRHHLNHGRFG